MRRSITTVAMSPQFGAFTASELFCPQCGRAQPVRERLLLLLPTGELYEYRCAVCATSLGERTVSGPAVQPSSLRTAATANARRSGPAPKRRLLH
jgi:hypothetical protein